MNRRAFLTTLAAGLAGAALDPERLLWVPGKKTIFLPPLRPIAAQGFLRAGDIFTINGFYAVNPPSRRELFVVREVVGATITVDRACVPLPNSGANMRFATGRTYTRAS
jgi:hypothetical protein